MDRDLMIHTHLETLLPFMNRRSDGSLPPHSRFEPKGHIETKARAGIKQKQAGKDCRYRVILTIFGKNRELRGLYIDRRPLLQSSRVVH